MKQILHNLCIFTCISCIPLYGMEKQIEAKLKNLTQLTKEIDDKKQYMQKLQGFAQVVTVPAQITIPEESTKLVDVRYTTALTQITTFLEELHTKYQLGPNLVDLKNNFTETQLKKKITNIETKIEQIKQATKQTETTAKQIQAQHADLIIENIKIAITTLEHLQKTITGNTEEALRMSTLLQQIDQKLGDAVSTKNNTRTVNKEKLKAKELKDLKTLYIDIRALLFAKPPAPKTKEQQDKEDIAKQTQVTNEKIKAYTDAFTQLLQAAGINKTPDTIKAEDLEGIQEPLKIAFQHLNTKKPEEFKLQQQNIATQITKQKKTIKANTADLTRDTKRLQELQDEYLEVLAQKLVIQAQKSKEEKFVVEESLKNYAGVKELPKDVTQQTQAIITSITTSQYYQTPSKQIKALKDSVPGYFVAARQKYKKQKK